MDHIFSVIKRTYNKDPIIVYIDLLGTSKYWRSTVPTEHQARAILQALLSDFHIVFNKHFDSYETKDSFDVNIFIDSIVISQRKSVKNAIERIVNFSLSYQLYLLQKETPNRVIIIKEAFFSYKLGYTSDNSILGSKYTSVCICGGRGIISAHEHQKGLPIGVYVDSSILCKLSKEHIIRIVGVRENKGIYFIKQKCDITSLLPDNTQKLILNKPSVGIRSIRRSLEVTIKDKDRINKYLPWILVHMGKENEI
jgi:hypothetical protein